LHPDSDTQVGSFFTPIFLLAVPILDTSVAVISRIKRHISPFQGGQDHLSHRLIRNGFTRSKAAFSLWILSAGFAATSLFISNDRINEYAVIVITCFMWIFLFAFFINKKDCE